VVVAVDHQVVEVQVLAVVVLEDQVVVSQEQMEQLTLVVAVVELLEDQVILMALTVDQELL